jgi:hypothetical protein
VEDRIEKDARREDEHEKDENDGAIRKARDH